MKQAVIFILVIPFFLLSCQEVKQQKDTNHTKVCAVVHANSIQEIGVKGMVCQMGCGGSIRKALKETCAVERVEVNYQDSLEEQIIKVHYDRQRIGSKQMLALLSELNDKQFTVRTIGSPQAIQ